MERAIRTKKVMMNGKTYNVDLLQDEYETIQNEVDICKLNGWDFQKMLNRLPHWTRKYWPEVAAECWEKSDPHIEVGTKATEILYSDRRAKTVVKVISPKEIVVAENETKCIDYFASKYEILDTIAEYMGQETYTLRRNGTWVAKGQPKKNGSVFLIVGMHDHYIDPSF